MPEFPVMHNWQTLIDKLQGWLNYIQQPKWSQKLEEDSISKERSLLPYWNEFCAEMSALLLSPTKTGYADLDLTLLNGCANNTGAKSWFSMKRHLAQPKSWLRTYSQSSTVSAQDFTDCESINLKCKKIRIYPSAELAKIWKQWVAACRYVYNQAIAYQRNAHKGVGKLDLRNIVMNSNLPDWVKQTPCHIRQNAIFDAWRAFKASKDAKFRSVRNSHQCVKFNDSNFKQGTWYPKLTKGLTFIASEPLKSACDQGTQLLKVKDRWYAISPEKSEIKPSQSDGVIALDPGVRTFITGFDGQQFIEVGASDFGRIQRLCQHLDKLTSRMSKVNALERRAMRRAAFRMRQKIRHLVDEMHNQVACYLTKNYRIIFLPTFESSDMVAKAKRKIRSKTARAMLTWAHYRFKQTLKHQAITRGVTVIEVSEAYTSKTCIKCGHIHSKLGGSKVFKCPNCNHKINRDFNGALGILLRALRDTSTLFEGAIVSGLNGSVQSCSA
jgi:putative transposase